MRRRVGSVIVFALAFFLFSDLYGQQEKRISFNGFLGGIIFPQSEKLNAAGQATNIFGGYPLAPTIGAGVNYRFNDRFMLGNNAFFMFSSKPHHSISALGLRTSLKYHIFKDWRKVSPYLSAGANIAFLNIRRDAYTEEFRPDTTANVIGSGLSVSRIIYNRSQLKLKMVPTPGASVGAGVNFKLKPTINLFIDYTFNHNFVTSSLIKDNFPQNASNMQYHFVSMGMTIKLLKPMKQMLASLKKEDWDGDPTVTIRGNVVYKKPKKSKELPVLVIDHKDTIVTVVPSSKNGYFEYKNLRADDYNFMLERKNKNVIKADVKVVHDNSKISVFEEIPRLEMIDDIETDNIITRDNNFSVLLREGFQHEVDVTVLGNKVIGKITPVSYDTLCRNMLVLLKDMNDSVIAVSTPEKDCSFSFPNVEQGKHTIVFVRNGIDKDINFKYSFDNPPFIRRQYNTEEDSIDFSKIPQVEIPEDTITVEDILLSRRFERKITTTEEFSDATSDTTPVAETAAESKPVNFSEIKPGPVYTVSEEVKVKDPKGYGVQIGAFSNTDNLQKFCHKISKERSEPIFVQAVQQENSYNPIVYRVIIGEYPDEVTANSHREELRKAGYDTVLRKHRPFERSRGR